jgi:hypothetical protein
LKAQHKHAYIVCVKGIFGQSRKWDLVSYKVIDPTHIEKIEISIFTLEIDGGIELSQQGQFSRQRGEIFNLEVELGEWIEVQRVGVNGFRSVANSNRRWVLVVDYPKFAIDTPPPRGKIPFIDGVVFIIEITVKISVSALKGCYTRNLRLDLEVLQHCTNPQGRAESKGAL